MSTKYYYERPTYLITKASSKASRTKIASKTYTTGRRLFRSGINTENIIYVAVTFVQLLQYLRAPQRVLYNKLQVYS